MTQHFNKIYQKLKRKNLRNNPTEEENILWLYLKSKQMCGFKFRRQYSVDQFILDFYCPKLNLAIEIDGGYHLDEEISTYDQARQIIIESFGIKFLRFSNQEIRYDIEMVLYMIKNKIKNLKEY